MGMKRWILRVTSGEQDDRAAWHNGKGAFFSAVLVSILVVGACAGDGGETEAGGGGNDGEIKDIRVIHTTGDVQPHRLNGYSAPLEFGEEFGVEQDDDTIQLFDSHNTGAQILLSGGADALGSSFTGSLQLIQAGQDVKLFCPYSRGFPSKIIGTHKVTELEQITDPNVRVAVESPGGPVNFAMDLVFLARGIDTTVEQLENTKIIEDSPLRLGALAAGEVDVALLLDYQVPELEREIGEENVHILSDVVADVGENAILLVFAARQEWLDENLEAATAFCASVLNANRSLAADFDLYEELANKYMEPDPETNVLRATWESLRNTELFPFNNGLNKEAVDFTITAAVNSGLIDPGLTYEQVVDPRPIEGALELLGGEVDPTEITQ